MLDFLKRSFGVYPVNRYNAAQALCNRLTAFKTLPPNPTPVDVTHAQVINQNGDVRMFTDDGKQYVLTITEVGS